MKKAVLIVLDGVGVGELPDAFLFGDVGAATLQNLSLNYSLELPILYKLGLGNIASIKGVSPNDKPVAAYGKMKEISKNKDSISGHWEIAGVKNNIKFPSFENGFPQNIINKFIKLNNLSGVLGNFPCSGTEIIKRLGEQHIKTKKPIVYTSADSVFQIACHKNIFSLEQLYEMCRITRTEIFNDKINIGRVIARPFAGESMKDFFRMDERKDFSVSPPSISMLDRFNDKKLLSAGIGKINDLFNSKGINLSIKTNNNEEGINSLLELLKIEKSGLIFVNLNDFDTKWGHRRDVASFAKGLNYFDSKISYIISALNEDDLLFITADHGCDPTFKGTDHTREYVPLLVYGRNVKPVNLGIRSSFADLSATILEYFNLEKLEIGNSFLNKIF